MKDFCRGFGSIVTLDNGDDKDNNSKAKAQLWKLFSSRGGGFPPANGESNGSNDNNSDNDNDSDDFPSAFPPNTIPGFPTTNGKGLSPPPPNKGDVYSDDELLNLLQLHEDINDQMKPNDNDNNSIRLPGESAEDGVPSLHDLVMQTVQKVDNQQNSKQQTKDAAATTAEQRIHQKVHDIIAIASDIDGTLLSSKHDLHPRTKQAIRKAVGQVSNPNNDNLQYFFPATGKSRKGALDSLGPEVRDLLSNLPGVFIQGLYCVDGDGNVVFEQKLSQDAVQKAQDLAAQLGVTILGYDGDYLYSNSASDPDRVDEINETWGEPRPKPLESLLDHSEGFHKLLLMHPDVSMLGRDLRPKLEVVARENHASVTTAVPTMLEVLPENCSKAAGVEKLCQALGIDPARQLLAIGDAENDVGMLQLAAIGVAVNNACELAKESADVVVEESNDNGGAGAAMEQYSRMNW
jgi:Cof subfamily protein (haloacid dehalogenase superfamily)